MDLTQDLAVNMAEPDLVEKILQKKDAWVRTLSHVARVHMSDFGAHNFSSQFLESVGRRDRRERSRSADRRLRDNSDAPGRPDLPLMQAPPGNGEAEARGPVQV